MDRDSITTLCSSPATQHVAVLRRRGGQFIKKISLYFEAGFLAFAFLYLAAQVIRWALTGFELCR